MPRKPIAPKKKGWAARRSKLLEPQVNEPVKNCLFVTGTKSSKVLDDTMKDLAALKYPNFKMLTRKNDIRPMEEQDINKLEELCRKENTALFAFANHNKKRPNNLILGRMFDDKLLDCIEMGVYNLETMQEIRKRYKTPAGERAVPPLLVFRGEGFENSTEGSELNIFKNLIMDTFRGPEDSNVDLSAIDIVLCFTQKSKNLSANDKKTNDNDNMEADSNDEEDREENNNNNDDGKQTPVIEVRGYKIEFESSKNSDSTNGNPTIKLLEHGPFMDLSIRRTRLANPSLAKLSRKGAKVPGTGKKQKNVTKDLLRGKVGQIHMHRQDTSKLVQRSRFKKALKRNTSGDDKKTKKMKSS